MCSRRRNGPRGPIGAIIGAGMGQSGRYNDPNAGYGNGYGNVFGSNNGFGCPACGRRRCPGCDGSGYGRRGGVGGRRRGGGPISALIGGVVGMALQPQNTHTSQRQMEEHRDLGPQRNVESMNREAQRNVQNTRQVPAQQNQRRTDVKRKDLDFDARSHSDDEFEADDHATQQYERHRRSLDEQRRRERRWDQQPLEQQYDPPSGPPPSYQSAIARN